MLQMNDLQPDNIYKHETLNLYVRLVRWVGDSESGGVATVEMVGQEITMALESFLRKYKVIHIQELAKDAYENQG